MNYKLEKQIDEVKAMTIEELCEKFNCKPSEICMGDYIASSTNDTVCPYKVILGFANFERSNVVSLGKLEIIYGKKLVDVHGKISDSRKQAVYCSINLRNSKITNLGKLRKVFGSISFNQYINSTENVEFFGSNLYLNNTNVKDLGCTRKIDGTLNIDDDACICRLQSLGKLKIVRAIHINSNSLRDLGEIEEIGKITFGRKCNARTRDLFEKNFTRDKDTGKFVRIIKEQLITE